MKVLRIAIDTDLCAGSGQCELFCPEVFEVKGGVGRVKLEAPENLRDDVLDAADACPTRAITVETG